MAVASVCSVAMPMSDGFLRMLSSGWHGEGGDGCEQWRWIRSGGGEDGGSDCMTVAEAAAIVWQGGAVKEMEVAGCCRWHRLRR